MKEKNTSPLSVDKNTEHTEVELTKRGNIINWCRIIVCFAIGGYISVRLFNDCLFCSDCCNPVAIVYFSFISLLCFLIAGVPVDKLIKISSLTGS